ncbi:hypothetical protein LEP3755_08620 [Leptolyngbya sp. NIES-3755]|nr:hypothetical protein LEP3755_08620 [Leptolyngbya sp. NIES-3755]
MLLLATILTFVAFGLKVDRRFFGSNVFAELRFAQTGLFVDSVKTRYLLVEKFTKCSIELNQGEIVR